MKKAIVIGAGVAGLAAAKRLQEHNIETIVLEARSKIGGRVSTDFQFADFPIELGGEYVHGDATVISDIIGEGHQINAGWRSGVALKVEGQWVPEEGRAPFTELYERMYDYILAEEDMSVEDWSRTTDAPQSVQRMVGLRVAGAYLTTPADISMRELIYESTVDHSGDGNFRVREGYERMLNTLAQGLDIRLNDPVSKVDWTGDLVTVTTTRGVAYEGAAVVVAVPLSILQSHRVDFNPPLPREKNQALESLMTGHVAKVVLKFKESFWPREPWIFIQDEPYRVCWDPGFGRAEAGRILSVFAVGTYAAYLDTLSETEIIRTAIKGVSQMFDRDVTDIFEEGKVMLWDKEPWIEGGYSYVPVGAFGSRQILAQPLGQKLFFAGEATAHISNPATVHGAIESGWRSAEEIIALNFL
jgi:monoamine oxidase